MSTRRLPLFPLHVVLFPGMPLPLHIFEERYRQMIGECIQASQPFGVCLIQAGEEVGTPAEPYLVGTEAEILSVQRLPDGCMNLLAVGRRRFRIVEITQWRPYVAGEIAYLTEDSQSAVEPAVLARVREELAGYIQGVLELAGETAERVGEEEGGIATPLIRVPRDPVELGYSASAALQIPAAHKQSLLEEPSPATRLARVLGYLLEGRAEQELLLRIQRDFPKGASPDDNGGITLN
jgi:Lon protease-like protein